MSFRNIIDLISPGSRSRQDVAACETADAAFALANAHREAGRQSLELAAVKRVLTLDPSHTEARARLGEIQFKAPAQPLFDDLKRGHPVEMCHVTIEIRNPCNFRCHYCVAKGSNNDPVKEFDLAAIERTLQTFPEETVYIRFECGGGEPTVHPQFPELLRICATRGRVSFPTNNSQNPERWFPRDCASKIRISAALHPEGEEQLDRYIRYAKYLIGSGCDFGSIFIAHPDRVSRIPHYKKLFAEAGIPFNPVTFIGEHDGRRYPFSYTEAEKEIIGIQMGDEDGLGWYHKIKPPTNRIRDFRGIPCVAGSKAIYLQRDGRMRRCLYDYRTLETREPSAKPCPVKSCGCGLFLDKLNTIDTPDVDHNLTTRLGNKTHDLSWLEPAAVKLGYSSAPDGLAEEAVRMYDELMRAYGKDEFPE